MIILLLFLSAFLSAVRYLEMDQVLVTLVTQPPEVYGASAIGLLLVRLGMAFVKYYPIFVRFVNSVNRMSEMTEDLYRSGSDTPRKESKDSPFKNGNPKRQFHSAVERRAPIGNRTNPSREQDRGSWSVIPRVDENMAQPTPLQWGGFQKKENTAMYRTTLLRLRFNLDKIHEYFLVKKGAPSINILKGIMIFAGTAPSVSSIKFCLSFARLCHKMIKEQGVKGLVMYLKAAHISLQQSLGGQRVHDAGKLGRRFARTKTGLPRFIPFHFRDRIRKGDSRAIRLALTFIGVYRVLSFPGVAKLGTITDSSTATGALNRYIQGLIPLFVKLFVFSRFNRVYLIKRLKRYATKTILPMFKGGPGAPGFKGLWNTHPNAVLLQGLALKMEPVLWESFSIIISLTSNWPVRDLIEEVVSLRLLRGVYQEDLKAKFLGQRIEFPTAMTPQTRLEPIWPLGKLGSKLEAAGKVRVFAMVDAWTQWALAPVHKLIFLILRDVPMDGTFDQLAPLKKVVPENGLWSLDLSAATDRLPITIQKSLLAAILGHEFANAWANLLIWRQYAYRTGSNVVVLLKYAVGQPMGALSSWASLAITHHFLVQVAAWRAGFPKGKLYSNYAILGDDVVVGNAGVARSYLSIMGSLGVGVNTSKSLLSPKGTALEFAKRTIFRGTDVSAVAWKEFFAATRNIGAFVELRRKFEVPFVNALAALGTGWRVRSWLQRPIGKLSARIRLLILVVNMPTDAGTVDQFFKLGQGPVPRYKNETKAVLLAFMEKEVMSLFSRAHALAPLSLGGETSNTWALDNAKVLGREHLRLDSSGPFPWEGDRSWHSLFRTTDLEMGSTNGQIYRLALVLRKIIHTLRVNQTKRWKVDLNRLIRAIALLANAMATLPKGDAQFSELYITFIKLSRELANYSKEVLATQRPNPQEVFGISTPQQVRLWKRWSHMLQGTSEILLAGDVPDPKEPASPREVPAAPFVTEKYPAPQLPYDPKTIVGKIAGFLLRRKIHSNFFGWFWTRAYRIWLERLGPPVVPGVPLSDAQAPGASTQDNKASGTELTSFQKEVLYGLYKKS